MAHIFSIRVKKNISDLKEGEMAHFFGYASGIMYEAFDALSFDAGLSGNGRSITITKDQAIKGLKKAIHLFGTIQYPDPTRITGLKRFLERIETDFKNVKYYIITFS